jgi:hypothetical protein
MEVDKMIIYPLFILNRLCIALSVALNSLSIARNLGFIDLGIYYQPCFIAGLIFLLVSFVIDYEVKE